MAGRSATEMIWFAVTIIVTISLIGVFIGIAYNYSSRIQDNARGEAANYYVDVEIINDPSSMPYNETSENLTLYVKNTGRYEIDISQILINVNGDGHYVNETHVDILGDETSWTQGTVAEINVSGPLETGEDHSVRIDVQGIYRGERMGRSEDTLEFHLEGENDGS